MATSISYSSTASGGKSLSKSITDINPNIDNAVAKTFTQKLNALTTNTLGSINRVDKTEIDPNITYYDIAISKDTANSEGTHITWDAASPTNITVQTFDAHEYLTLILKVNNLPLNFEFGIPYIVERHSNSEDGVGTNAFTVVSMNNGSFGLCFDFLGGINGTVTVTIPSGIASLGNPAHDYYFNGLTFTITGESD